LCCAKGKSALFYGIKLRVICTHSPPTKAIDTLPTRIKLSALVIVTAAAIYRVLHSEAIVCIRLAIDDNQSVDLPSPFIAIVFNLLVLMSLETLNHPQNC